MTQTERILTLLRQAGDEGLTAIEALDQVGSFRLAARIHDLRRQGHDIEARIRPTPRGSRVACYVLREQLHLFADVA